jgi:hypothetical protein
MRLRTTFDTSLPNFRLEMNAEVRELIEEDGVIRGVRYETPDGTREARALLTVALMPPVATKVRKTWPRSHARIPQSCAVLCRWRLAHRM